MSYKGVTIHERFGKIVLIYKQTYICEVGSLAEAHKLIDKYVDGHVLDFLDGYTYIETYKGINVFSHWFDGRTYYDAFSKDGKCVVRCMPRKSDAKRLITTKINKGLI